eukprot:TRINITY_DN2711_c0_g2_i1.p1 TRINITY_DN2711_c0_g2~~TRINITY_DN2711_c0_g2_i1.p1  ORF type:complete len:682 (+),score=103.49 TRINITY_DN2711_c0_g2_i1:61-2106(+)
MKKMILILSDLSPPKNFEFILFLVPSMRMMTVLIGSSGINAEYGRPGKEINGVEPMCTAECRNQYLQFITKTDYNQLKTQLLKNISKSTTKLIPVLQKLCLYNLELDLIPYLIPLLQNEDKKLLRLVYFLLGDLAATHNARERYMNMVVDKMCGDFGIGGMRAIVALKTFSGYRYTMSGKPITIDQMRRFLRGEDLSESFESQKRKGFTTFFAKKRDESTEIFDAWIIYTVLFEYQTRCIEHLSPKEFLFVVEAMQSNHDFVVRSAICATSQYSKIEQNLVLSTLHEKLRDNSESNNFFHFKNIYTHMGFLKLCSNLGNKDQYVMYHLHVALFHENLAIFFTALDGLLKYDWYTFVEDCYRVDLWPPTPGTKTVLEVVVERLKLLLVHTQPAPHLHAALRVIALLAEKYLVQVEKELARDNRNSNSIVSCLNHPLYSLQQPILGIMKKVKGFVRLKILEASIWLTLQSNSNQLKDLIMNEINFLPSELFHRILSELLRRLQTSPGMATTALHLIQTIFRTHPSKVNPEMLPDMWQIVMEFGSQGRQKVLANIFDLLSTEHKESEDKEQITHIYRLCYWALGCYANNLSQEFVGLRCPLGSASSKISSKDSPSEVTFRKTKTTLRQRKHSKIRSEEDDPASGGSGSTLTATSTIVTSTLLIQTWVPHPLKLLLHRPARGSED